MKKFIRVTVMTQDKKTPEQFDDAWLTRALEARASAEPRPGLEERILARLASGEEQRQTSTWKWWVAPAAALATLLIVLAGHEFFRPRPITEPTNSAATSASDNPTNVGPNSRDREARSPRLVRGRPRRSIGKAQTATKTLPKLDHFPAETPVTDQERLLVQLVQKQSSTELALYARSLAAPEDLTVSEKPITPLSIAPMDFERNPNY
jgi:hypothetical protein